ncbi:MAG: hypothetical protein HQK54_16615 [Oligoflexales bacterium]|nr:hypothetical protein [Oligoflexales bacterium]
MSRMVAKNRIVHTVFLFSMMILFASEVSICETASFPKAYSSYTIDFPAYESPFNSIPSGWPSMEQSLNITAASFQTIHHVFGRLVNPYRGDWKGFWGGMAFVGLDISVTALPPFDAWLHEEFHRAVMGRYGISSFNDVYYFRPLATTISVSHVNDEDLIALKRDHPADMVRLPAAGIEGQSQLVLNLEKAAFFDNVAQYHGFTYLYSYLNSYFYVASGPTHSSDTLTDEMNQKESTIKERDFVGHDFTSWVYDLFRPDEPYEARGLHPSGTGINRYRKASDLTSDEKRFLSLQGNLQLLNLIDPIIWRIDHWPLDGEGGKINGTLQHYLTSFGYTVNANIFLKTGDKSLFFTILNYHNKKLSLPGLSVELRKYRLGSNGFLPNAVSVRLGIWEQPAHQRFDDKHSKLGGLGRVTLFFPVFKRTDAYFEVEKKSPGWVAGSPYLGENATGRLGVSILMF